MKRLIGEIKVSARLGRTERYINSLIYDQQRKIRNIEYLDGEVLFACSPTDYLSVARSAHKLGGKTRVVGRRGIYFWLRRHSDRYGIVLGTMGYILVTVILSCFVWDIRVTGNELLSDQQIIDQIATSGIAIGKSNRGLNKTQSEIAMLLELDKLAWVSVELTGSRIEVKITERDESIAPIANDTPCNIIAGKAGRIIDSEVYRGQMVLEKGSGVAKGDLIVSGAVRDGAGNILYQHSSAKIIAECEEFVTFFAPYLVTEKKKTGREVQHDYLMFLGNEIPLFLHNYTPKNYIFSEETRKCYIFGLPLPYKIRSAIYQEQRDIDITYPAAETKKRLDAQIDLYQKNFYKNAEIINWDIQYLPADDGIRANLFVTYQMDIAETAEIYLH